MDRGCERKGAARTDQRWALRRGESRPIESPEHERRAVVEYFLAETPDPVEVMHVEKIASERIYGQRHDIWDLHASDGRWWIITNPTNLYSQEQHPSMDMALTVHLGIATRLFARDFSHASQEAQDRLTTPFRRLEQAADALNRADEAEEFQAVGMRCRECLLAFVNEVADDAMAPAGQEPPKRGDFIHWSEHVADAIAGGSSATRVRAHLKAIARSTWELVSWLTHATNAARFDGQIALDATEHVLSTFSTALIRHERGTPDRCPVCGSYRLTSDYRPELSESAYVTLCEACGWEDAGRTDDEVG